MTPWEVIEDALLHKKPRRNPQWLAEQLGVSIQVVSNWKQRGSVPPARYREIANVLGISVDQLEGLEPLPWQLVVDESVWPFKRVRLDEVMALSPEDRAYLEGILAGELERLSTKPTDADLKSFEASHVRMRGPTAKKRRA